MGRPYYVTTPIYYVNARPHLGHAYTTIVADVTRRFQEMQGKETYFLTGTDEHGDKIVRAAAAEGLTPREYVDQISDEFRRLWPELNISNSDFIRTTDPNHIRVVKQILQRIYDSGDIYFAQYKGLYCFGCERFYTERELVDGKCPDHETEPEEINESNYFFRMSNYQQWLIDHIKSEPDFIRPQRYRNEVLSFLKEPLEDLCISRPKSRLKWGITLPFDHNYVTYVWFDALINYVSALGYPDDPRFEKFWPVAQHTVAKDILKPHGIYWPIMLKAAGIPVYRHLNVHGYWNIDASKMSKSLGNVVEPLALKNVYGLDAFRFFLMRDMVFGLDSSFSEDALIQRINADLANDIGNLFSRVVTMVHKYCKARVPEPDAKVERELALGLQADAWQAVEHFERDFAVWQFHKGLMAVWEFIGQMNRCIDVTAPWELAKRDTTRKQLDTVLYNLIEGLRVISGLIYPVMPDTAAVMQRHLGVTESEKTESPFYDLDRLKKWQLTAPGTTLPKSTTLFPRVEQKTRPTGRQPAAQETPKPPPKTENEITLSDLSKIDLRVATILRAEPIAKAKKLLRIEVDAGDKRTVVAGIATHYKPEQLVGKQVIIVANLKPAKLMGVRSQGMLLAAVEDDLLTLATVDTPAPPGTRLR